MPKKPLVHLIIPQLFQPLKLWKKGYKIEVQSDYFTKLLQSYKYKQQPAISGMNASLFSSLGFATEEELPVAYYRYQAHCNSLPSKNTLLLCADPVHLVVGMSDITLTNKITDLTQVEAKEFINLLNTHFNQDGLTFILGSNSQWYVSVQAIETISTTPIEVVIRKNIADYPIQSDHRNWQVLQNEMQMLLHSAPLNQSREMAGLPTVNSLWLWGGGMPQAVKHKASLVLSDNAISGMMLASAAQCDYQKYNYQKCTFQEPSNEQGTTAKDIDKNTSSDYDFSKLPEGKTIIINESLVEPAINDDLDAYQIELEKLDKYCIKPLYALWKNNKINIQIDSCNGKLITPLVTPSWKFWKKTPSSLSELDL
jgi:hypothetical protein